VGVEISVMVSVRDDWRVLRLLESLRTQNLDPARFEVVLVNNGREDYGSRLEGFPFDVTTVRTGGGRLAAARSRGFEHVRGAYFATTDADCVTSPGWLAAILDSFALADAGLVGVGGAICKYATETLVQRYGITANDGQQGLQYLPASPLPYITGANAAYRTEAVREVGGYDTSYSCGEDVDISYRLGQVGGRLAVNPQAVVWHEDRRRLSEHFRRFRGYSVDQALLFKRYRGGDGRSFCFNDYPWRRLGLAAETAVRGVPNALRGDWAGPAEACATAVEALGIIAGDIEGSVRHRVIYV
jgi:GT2 family glycosyltransferase